MWATKMDIRTLSSHNLIPVIDPAFLKQSPDEFLAENGGFLSEVAIVGKSTSGFVHYRSATAPMSRDSNEFFSTFASIADSIGIKVHGFVHALADSFLAKNRGYAAIKDGGNPSPDFVCPTKESYINYLNSIIKEITNFPVKGLIIDNIRFPREEYSFCESCCRSFSEKYNIDRIFSLNDLQKDATLIQNWIDWRKEKIETIIKEVSSSVKNRSDLNFTIIMDVDPTLQAEKGALRQFGQDINIIAKHTSPCIHLSAWSPLPKSTSGPEYKLLSRSLQFVKEFKQTHQEIPVNLYLWGIENDSQLGIIESLKEEVAFKKVFVQNHLPEDYQKRREIHLGISS
jgi:hypothetical protein